MKAITVKQPWAWAITYGGKRVENRTVGFRHRGPLAIHAALVDDEEGGSDERVRAAWRATSRDEHRLVRGAVIAVADLVDVHRERRGCCAPWGVPGAVHLVLAAVRPLPVALPCRGQLGLWALPEDVAATIGRSLPAVTP